jgi:hypothetical protein
MHCNHFPTPGLSKIFALGMDRANVFLTKPKACLLAAENVDVAAGHRKMLAVLALGPREGPWRVRQLRASVVEKLRAAWAR